MKLFVIIGQHNEGYGGYGPTALAVMDEVTFMDNAVSQYAASPAFAAVGLLTLEVPDEDVIRSLYPCFRP